jgi:4-hydroxybenzoate polyprenyltransferase
LSSALKIVIDVVAFRLRRLEMANLAGAVAIALALRLPPLELGWRAAFAALLNVLVYLNNDYFDVILDQRAPDKDQRKVRFMREHMGAALLAQGLLTALLVLLALAHSPGLMLTLFAGAGICVAYSKWWKHLPFVDVLAMTAWGIAMPLSGCPLDSAAGLCLAGQLGLMSAVFESIQVTRDHDADRALGVRTTAVALGVRRTMWLARALMLGVSAYAALVLHPVAGAITALTLLLPWPVQRTEAFWTKVKLVYGAAWLWACAGVFLARSTDGLLLSVDARDTLELLRWAR